VLRIERAAVRAAGIGWRVYDRFQPMRPSLRELVDAAIEKRPYDWHRLSQPLNTDELCGSEKQNLEAGSAIYSINDPEGMTHADAEAARSRGETLSVERDQVRPATNPSGD